MLLPCNFQNFYVIGYTKEVADCVYYIPVLTYDLLCGRMYTHMPRPSYISSNFSPASYYCITIYSVEISHLYLYS